MLPSICVVRGNGGTELKESSLEKGGLLKVNEIEVLISTCVVWSGGKVDVRVSGFFCCVVLSSGVLVGVGEKVGWGKLRLVLDEEINTKTTTRKMVKMIGLMIRMYFILIMS